MKFKIRPSLLCLLFAGLTAACDVLNEETPQEYDVQVLTDKVFVSELQGSSTISLHSLIRAKVPVKFSIAENAHRGTLDLVDIDKGIIKYSAAYGAIQPDDFKFVVSSANNTTLKEQQVNLVLADEQDDLPCGTVVTFDDHFINLGAPGTVVTLDVLKNDWMCDDMRSQVELHLYPESSATVTADNKISYTVPAWSSGDGDQYSAYYVALKSNPAVRWSGGIRLTFDNVCELGAGYIEDNEPNDGLFGYSLPMVTASTIRFNPLTQASLCGYSLGEIDVTIIHQPLFGTAQVHPSKSFSYTPANAARESYTDLIIYKITLPNGKWVAQILRLRLANGTACTQGAVDDVFGIENAIYHGGGAVLPVGANDCNPKSITSISIVTPPLYGSVTRVGYFPGGWGIIYNPNNTIDKKLDVMEYQIVYQDGSTSRAKAYVQPFDYGN